MQHMYNLEFPGTDWENVHLSQFTALKSIKLKLHLWNIDS